MQRVFTSSRPAAWIHALLAALLRQNPRFEAGNVRPTGRFVRCATGPDECRQRIRCSSMTPNANGSCAACSTTWLCRLPCRGHLRHQPRVVRHDARDRADCSPTQRHRLRPRCVPGGGQHRKLVQRNVFSPSSIFNYSRRRDRCTPSAPTPSSRPTVWSAAPTTRSAKQACYGAQRDRLILVQYESPTADSRCGPPRHP